MRCSICGKKISVVLYIFTSTRYGTPYCYKCMKDSNSERNVYMGDLKAEIKYKNKKK